jgi:hypothetical protein
VLFGVTVELYELRPEPGPVRNRLFGASSKAGLHIESLKLAAQVIAFMADCLPPRQRFALQARRRWQAVLDGREPEQTGTF